MFPFPFYPARVVALIPGNVGTPIGDMTSNGGLAAAFDGVNVKTIIGDAASSTTGGLGNYSGRIGKNWGSGVTKTIKKVVIYGGSYNYGFSNVGSGTTINLKVQGSTDNFSSSIVDLATGSVVNSPSAVKTFNLADLITTTAYQYHRITITETGGSGGHTMAVSQVEFWA